MEHRERPDTTDAGQTVTRRTALAGAAAIGAGAALLGSDTLPALAGGAPVTIAQRGTGPAMNFVLSHEQFPVPRLVEYGAAAERTGFDGIWTSDHFQPWQDNQSHAGQAWVTLSAITQRTSRIRLGTGVTTPTFKYRPAIVAEAFASLSLLAPGRIFLGLGTGEKLNEGAAGGGWALYPERAARLVEAVQIIRGLWSGQPVNFNGQYYQVNGKLYDPPAQPIPIYIAAGGPKSARLAGQYGDGLVADPLQLMTNPGYKAAFAEGARAAGKDPSKMPILLEHFVVVGDMNEAMRDAELWRFTAKSWKPGYFNNISPVAIRKRAEAEIPLQTVFANWPVSTDPNVHIQAIQKLVTMGVTHVFVHSAQQDQLGVIDYFSRYVLPKVRNGGVTGVRQVNGL